MVIWYYTQSKQYQTKLPLIWRMVSFLPVSDKARLMFCHFQKYSALLSHILFIVFLFRYQFSCSCIFVFIPNLLSFPLVSLKFCGGDLLVLLLHYTELWKILVISYQYSSGEMSVAKNCRSARV